MTDRSGTPDPLSKGGADSHGNADSSSTDQQTDAKGANVARLFDIRRIIGGLFVLYGVVLTVTGMTDSQAEIDKAQGININLWTGLGMLVLGLGFLVWLKLSPTPPPPSVEERAAAEERPAGH
jgi:hypothetical protein